MLHAGLILGRLRIDDPLPLMAERVNEQIDQADQGLALGVGKARTAATASPVFLQASCGAGCGLLGVVGHFMTERVNEQLNQRHGRLALGVGKGFLAVLAPPVFLQASFGAGCGLRLVMGQGVRMAAGRGNLGSLVLLCMADGALLVLHAGLILGRLRVRHPKPSMSGRGNLLCCLDFILSRLVGEQPVALLAAPVCLAALLGTRRRLFRNHCQRVSERAQEFRCVNDVLALAVGEQHFAILAFPVCLISAQCAGGCQCGNRLKGMTLRGDRSNHIH